MRSTFCLLDGVGAGLEKRLWKEGILSWADFISAEDMPYISPERKSRFDGALMFAQGELDACNSRYFADVLPRGEHWRLFEEFREGAVCLDIETNGMAPGRGGHATMVGLYDGRQYKCLVRGEDLTPDALEEELSRYGLLVTFFGSAFDVPFLKATMRGLDFGMPHFDLCMGARRLGMKGGLKRLEPMFGIERPECVKGVSSYDAVLLWQYYKDGSDEALDMLKLYNQEDTVNLARMADEIYARLRAGTGIEKYII